MPPSLTHLIFPLVLGLFEYVTRSNVELSQESIKHRVSTHILKFVDSIDRTEHIRVNAEWWVQLEQRYHSKIAELTKLRGTKQAPKQATAWWRRLISRRRAKRQQAA